MLRPMQIHIQVGGGGQRLTIAERYRSGVSLTPEGRGSNIGYYESNVRSTPEGRRLASADHTKF